MSFWFISKVLKKLTLTIFASFLIALMEARIFRGSNSINFLDITQGLSFIQITANYIPPPWKKEKDKKKRKSLNHRFRCCNLSYPSEIRDINYDTTVSPHEHRGMQI